MTTDLDALLAGCLAAPDDDGAIAVLADYLTDNPGQLPAALARLLRYPWSGGDCLSMLVSDISSHLHQFGAITSMVVEIPAVLSDVYEIPGDPGLE